MAGRAALHRHLPADRVDPADRPAAGRGRVCRSACPRSTRRRAGRRRAGVRRRRQAGRAGGRGGDHDGAVRLRPDRGAGRHGAARRTSTDCCAVGFCIGGHLAFRAAFDPGSPRRSASTRPACTTARWARTPTPGRSAAAADIQGRLMIIFGSQDPHVPADARLPIVSALYAAGLDDLELHVYPAASTRSCGTSAPARPGADRSRAHRGGVVPDGPVAELV